MTDMILVSGFLAASILAALLCFVLLMLRHRLKERTLLIIGYASFLFLLVGLVFFLLAGGMPLLRRLALL